jgi:hypothetical protein
LIPAVEVAAHMSIHGIQRAQREGYRMDRATSRALDGEYAWAYDLLIGRLVSRQRAFVAERSVGFWAYFFRVSCHGRFRAHLREAEVIARIPAWPCDRLAAIEANLW